MMLLDKGYYDYDYEKVEAEVRWEETVKTEEEVHDMLAMFGMGNRARMKPKTTEDIQNYIIKQEGYGG